jgi:hypothetical protein
VSRNGPRHRRHPARPPLPAPRRAEQISPFLSGVLTLALFQGAYLAEIVRAGIEAVDRGQWEAGRALGLSERQLLHRVVMPQATRIMLPPLANEFINTIKWSSIVSIISIQELTFQGLQVMASTQASIEIWLTISLMYLLLCLSLSLAVRRLEQHFALADGTHPIPGRDDAATCSRSIMKSASSPFAIRNVRLFIAFRVLFNARFYYPVFTILFLDYGLTIEQFALLNTVWALVIVLAEVPSGALADILGRKYLLVGTAVIMTAEMCLLAFVPLGNPTLIFAVFLVNRVLSGLAEAMASGADEAIAYDSLLAEGRAEDWPRVLSLQMVLRSMPPWSP